MKVNSLVKLDVPLKKIRDPFLFIEKQAMGRYVLNVGAAGGIQTYLPANVDIWLHERIRRCAADLIGIDIDRQAINHAEKYGYKILNENCETMKLNKKFDLIVMSDVIEHVNAPVTAINNLLSHLNDDGQLILTTPNATAGNIMLRSVVRKDFNVLYDHVTTYYPEHFQAICDRLGCNLSGLYIFDHIDRRTMMFRIKSIFFQAMTIVSKRLASSILVVIKKSH